MKELWYASPPYKLIFIDQITTVGSLENELENCSDLTCYNCLGGFDYDKWEELWLAQGMLCRANSDCNWIANDLDCERQHLPFDPDVCESS